MNKFFILFFRKYSTLLGVLLLSVFKFSMVYAIYNGTPEPDLSKYQFMVSVQIYDGTNYQHKCGGSIISQTMILTAGHCVVDGNAKIFAPSMEQVVTRNNEVYKIKSIYLKPNFYFPMVSGLDGVSLAENDLAILELDRPIIDEKIVNLPIKESVDIYYKQGNKTLALGYGNYNESQIVSYPILRTAEMNISELKWVDVENLKMSLANQYLYSDDFVGVYSISQAPTSHDSGSPLLLINHDNSFVLIGVTSNSPNLLTYFQPTAYTKTAVSKNLDWIKQIISQNAQ